MNFEVTNRLVREFLAAMTAKPWDLASLLLMVVLVFWFFRKVTGNASRENWFKETRLKEMRKNQSISPGEEIFLKSRIHFRRLYWSLSSILLLSLPLTYEYFLIGFRRYGPVLLEHWYVLIGAYVLYRILSMLNAYMNLKLLAQEVEREQK